MNFLCSAAIKHLSKVYVYSIYLVTSNGCSLNFCTFYQYSFCLHQIDVCCLTKGYSINKNECGSLKGQVTQRKLVGGGGTLELPSTLPHPF